MGEPEKIYVKPSEMTDGAVMLVRDEHTRQPIPRHGAEVLHTRMVRRRIAAGDLVEAEKPAESEATDATGGDGETRKIRKPKSEG
jgi:hypothetical protein